MKANDKGEFMNTEDAKQSLEWHEKWRDRAAKAREKFQRGEYPGPQRNDREIETYRMESGLTAEQLKSLPF